MITILERRLSNKQILYMYTLMLEELLNRKVAFSTLAVIAFVLFICHCVLDNAAASDPISRERWILNKKFIAQFDMLLLFIALFNFFQIFWRSTLIQFFLLIDFLLVMRVDENYYIPLVTMHFAELLEYLLRHLSHILGLISAYLILQQV